jgi:hypothetical protein
MTVSRKEPRTAVNHAADGRDWTRPSIRRLAAGRAEQGADVEQDLGFNQS